MSNIIEEGSGERATKRRRENDQDSDCLMEVNEKVEMVPPEIWTCVIECEFIQYFYYNYVY